MDKTHPEGGIVIAGCGTLAVEVVRELLRLGRPNITVIDDDPRHFEGLWSEVGDGVRVVVGDPLDEEVLRKAGLLTASGLIATLERDRQNLFLCLTATQLTSGLRVVTKINELTNANKFRQVGATAVVSPSEMGGTRLAQVLVRPEMAEFADAMVASEDRRLLLQVFEVERRSPAAGKRLSELDIHGRTGCIVMGVRSKRRKYYRYRPGPLRKLRVGTQIMALGDARELRRLAAMLGGEPLEAIPPLEVPDLDEERAEVPPPPPTPTTRDTERAPPASLLDEGPLQDTEVEAEGEGEDEAADRPALRPDGLTP